MVLAGKIATTFQFYYEDLTENPMQAMVLKANFMTMDSIFGKHTYRLILSLSCPIFLLLVEAHHYTKLNSPRQLYLSHLVGGVTMDILDTIFFMDLLWLDKVGSGI